VGELEEARRVPQALLVAHAGAPRRLIDRGGCLAEPQLVQARTLEKRDVAVVVERNRVLIHAAGQYVAAEERAVVRHVEHAENGGGDVELTRDRIDLPRLEMRRRIDHEWNFVRAQRKILFAVDARAMVRDDHHGRIVEVRLRAKLLDEAADRVVGVAHACLASAAFRLHTFDAFGERERLVIGRAHHH
jgi:hypothetical protein